MSSPKLTGYGGTTNPGSGLTLQPATDTVMAILIEAGGIVVVTIIAGLSDRVGTMMIIVLVGLWLLFLMNNTTMVTNFATTVANIQTGAKSG